MESNETTTMPSAPQLIGQKALIVAAFATLKARRDLIWQLAVGLLLVVGGYGIIAAGIIFGLYQVTSLAIVAAVGVLLYIGFILFASILGFGLVIALLSDMPISLFRGAKQAFAMFLSLLWIAFLIQFIQMTGMVLLIIPGLIFAVYSGFSILVRITEGSRGIDAVLRSTQIIYGHFWTVIWRAILFGLVMVPVLVVLVGVGFIVGLGLSTLGMIGGVVMGVLALLVYVCALLLSATYFIALFSSLRALQPAPTTFSAGFLKVRKLYVIAAWIGVPIFIAYNGFNMYATVQDSTSPAPYETETLTDEEWWAALEAELEAMEATGQ